MNKKENLIKVVGFITTVLGICVTIVTDWVNDKKIDEKIEEKIKEAFDNQENQDE